MVFETFVSSVSLKVNLSVNIGVNFSVYSTVKFSLSSTSDEKKCQKEVKIIDVFVG